MHINKKTERSDKKIKKRTLWLGVSLLMVALLLTAPLVAISCPVPAADVGDHQASRNVIFYHPDGYGVTHWNALRFLLAGPDGRLNWDRLPHMAPYTGHMKDALTASSHGGATTHAYGVKVVRDSFGMDGHDEITALSGNNMSIMEEAIKADFATALIQSGCITEPGTAVFVSSVKKRRMYEEIAAQVIESGVDVMLSGGEAWLLPEGVTGRHGEGKRKDGVNLIKRAKQLGYTVVYTRDELMAARGTATKLLGVFAHKHTFNAMTEEVLRVIRLPLYVSGSPTIAEMSRVALEVLSRNPKAQTKGTFVVAEEEGTDNFGNLTNARGSFEAGKRADEAFGVFTEFIENNPNTLLITTADSSAGGKHILGPGEMADDRVQEADINSGPVGIYVRAPLDGIGGSHTTSFIAAPDRAGKQFPFAIAWATRHDLSGGIVVRAKGLNADMVSQFGVVDNTDIYSIMYYTMFNRWLPAP